MANERLVNLVSPKHGDAGQIRVRLVFQPEIIAKSRKATSTFTTAGRAMTTVAGLPMNAGKGVFHGVAGVFKRDHAHEESALDASSNIPTGQASGPVGAADMTTPFPSENGNGHVNNEPGTLRITVLDAKDLPHADVKPYATIRVGDKEFKTKHPHKSSSPEW